MLSRRWWPRGCGPLGMTRFTSVTEGFRPHRMRSSSREQPTPLSVKQLRTYETRPEWHHEKWSYPMRSRGFGSLRAHLIGQTPSRLVRLIGELYRLSDENRRYVHSRLGDRTAELPRYRQLVAEALRPDPLQRNSRVRIADARKAISQYQRATGDLAGTVDLMLTFVENGTGFAVDVGYGDDHFFSSLESMLSRALEILGECGEELRRAMRPRLIHLRATARDIGWGYGDFVADAISDVIEGDA